MPSNQISSTIFQPYNIITNIHFNHENMRKQKKKHTNTHTKPTIRKPIETTCNHEKVKTTSRRSQPRNGKCWSSTASTWCPQNQGGNFRDVEGRNSNSRHWELFLLHFLLWRRYFSKKALQKERRKSFSDELQKSSFSRSTISAKKETTSTGKKNVTSTEDPQKKRLPPPWKSRNIPCSADDFHWRVVGCHFRKALRLQGRQPHKSRGREFPMGNFNGVGIKILSPT